MNEAEWGGSRRGKPQQKFPRKRHRCAGVGTGEPGVEGHGSLDTMEEEEATEGCGSTGMQSTTWMSAKAVQLCC